MGKGDRKTAKGKRYNSSYGNTRSAGGKATDTAAPVAKKSTASKAASKAAAKKVVAKKTVAKE